MIGGKNGAVVALLLCLATAFTVEAFPRPYYTLFGLDPNGMGQSSYGSFGGFGAPSNTTRWSGPSMNDVYRPTYSWGWQSGQYSEATQGPGMSWGASQPIVSSNYGYPQPNNGGRQPAYETQDTYAAQLSTQRQRPAMSWGAAQPSNNGYANYAGNEQLGGMHQGTTQTNGHRNQLPPGATGSSGPSRSASSNHVNGENNNREAESASRVGGHSAASANRQERPWSLSKNPDSILSFGLPNGGSGGEVGKKGAGVCVDGFCGNFNWGSLFKWPQ